MKRLLPLILRFIAYALSLVSISLIMRQDFKDAQVLEDSGIEIAQESLLVLSILILLFSGKKWQLLRIFNLALAGVLSVHFVREFDFWLNYNLFDKAWQLIAGVLVIITLAYMFKNFKQLIVEIVEVSKTYAFAIFLVGFTMLHVFSRLFGSKSLWNYILEPIHSNYESLVGVENTVSLEDFVWPIKTAAQESIELLAYTIMFIGVVELLVYVKNKN